MLSVKKYAWLRFSIALVYAAGKTFKYAGCNLQSGCILRVTMHRRIRVAISIAAVMLLARPFECFASNIPDPRAMDCCLKGKCAPTAKSDECCKNKTPEGKALATAKTASDSSCLLAQAVVRGSLPFHTAFSFVNDPLQHPPPAGLACRNLPLLI